MLGMKLLVNYLCAQPDGDNEEVLGTAGKVINIFLGILKDASKGMSGDKDKKYFSPSFAIGYNQIAPSEADREYMRQSAAISLINLARHKGFESLITEDDFQTLAFSVHVHMFSLHLQFGNSLKPVRIRVTKCELPSSIRLPKG